MKVLVHSDTHDTLDVIKMCFGIRWPDTTFLAANGATQTTRLIEMESPDIVMLDLDLPGLNGLQLLQDIRRFSDVPVILLTTKDDQASRVGGLEMGADDFIAKPFFYTELLARAKAVLRRSHMPHLRGDEGVITGRDVTIDLAGHRLLLHGREVNLTPSEWKLLAYLARNEGRVVPHRMLAEKVWGSEFLDSAAIKMCVRRLRLKLGDDPRKPHFIRSHRGIGYSLLIHR